MAWEEIEKPLVGVPRMRRGERVRYVPNRASFGAFMKSDQMRDVTEKAAVSISLLAKATVPAPSEKTDPDRATADYQVKRNAGLLKVGGNLRVRVLVEGIGEGAERAEFGGPRDKRYRTLAEAGSTFGDWKPVD